VHPTGFHMASMNSSEEGPLPVFGTGRLSVEPLVVIGLRQGPLNEKRPPNGGGLLLHCGSIMTY
jgi:hypothetical protein